jgi:ABC-type glutathione transport system ATPase component
MIEVQELFVTYRSGIIARHTTNAVIDVSLDVPQGSMIAIVGESGCGKSTLLRAISGMIRPNTGKIRINNQPFGTHPNKHPLHRAKLIQLIAQQPELAFDPRQTIASALNEVLLLHECKTRNTRIKELFSLVGLHSELHNRYPHELSGGQLQRAAVARALAPNPKVLLLDEPTSMLDASVQARIITILQTIRRDFGVTMILVTHDIYLARVVADTIAVMYQGRLVELGPAEKVFSLPQHQHTISLVQATQTLHNLSST